MSSLYRELFQEQRREKANDIDIRMLVHQSHAGAIIGRGGSKIKELREQTHSNLKVHQECCPNSTDRVVQILTGQENMPSVVKTLIDFLKDVSCVASFQYYMDYFRFPSKDLRNPMILLVMIPD